MHLDLQEIIFSINPENNFYKPALFNYLIISCLCIMIKDDYIVLQ